MSLDAIRNSIEGARRYLSEHPEEGRSPDRAAVAVLEGGLRCRVEGPEGTSIVTDMPVAVGGAGSAPTPGWLSRAALASCDATVIAMRAAELGIELERLEVTAESESDSRGLLGVDDSVPAGPLSSTVRVRIAARGVPEERLRELVAWTERHSPVGDLIRRSVVQRVEVEVESVETEVGQ